MPRACDCERRRDAEEADSRRKSLGESVESEIQSPHDDAAAWCVQSRHEHGQAHEPHEWPGVGLAEQVGDDIRAESERDGPEEPGDELNGVRGLEFGTTDTRGLNNARDHRAFAHQESNVYGDDRYPGLTEFAWAQEACEYDDEPN